MKHALGLAIAALAAFVASSASADEFEPLRNALKSSNIGFYRPVNSVYGAGWVYREERDDQGNRYPVTLCPDAYAGVPNHTIDRNVILASGVTTRTSDMGFSLSLLEKLLRNLASATLGVRRSGLTSTTITWGPVTLVELSPRFQESGTARQVSRACTENLRPYLDSHGRFTTPVYIVRRVAIVRHLEYRFTRRASSGAGSPASGQASPAAGSAGSAGSSSSTQPSTPPGGGSSAQGGHQPGGANSPASGAGNAPGQPSQATDASANVAVHLNDLLDFSANVTFMSGQDVGFVVDIPADQSPIVVGANAIRMPSWQALASVNEQAQVELDDHDESDPSIFSNAP